MDGIVPSLGAQGEAVLAAAGGSGRVLLSADTDFGELLAVGRHPGPSVVLFRRAPRRPEGQVLLLVASLPDIEESLVAGAVVVVVLVGIDVHKATHCAVAVDELGRQLGKPLTVRATDAGHLQLLRWAGRSFPEQAVEFAVEDCRHVSTRLERALLAAAATVIRVPPKLMAGARSSARTRGKSDPIDALAIARAALREPDLPRAEHTHASRDLKLLVDHREDLVNTRTALQNRLRWHLHELDPDLDPAARGLDRQAELDRVQCRLEALPDTVVRRISLELLADIRSLSLRATALEKELKALVQAQAPQLLALPGCGVLTAAKLLGETANPARFRSEA